MQRFKRKHLLMDTNLLIYISKYLDTGIFDDFLDELKENDIKPVIEQATLFEFKRGSQKQSHIDGKDELLKYLLGDKRNQMVLPSSTSKEILDNALDLAILYSHHDIKLSKQISFIDCLVASQLMKFKNNLCLATLDNNDYPLCIFDRVKLFTIDAKKEILNIGIYVFNEEKYKKCKSDFKKAI